MDGGSDSREFGRVALAAALLVLLLIAVGWALAPGDAPDALSYGMARYFLIRQDWLVGVVVAATAALMLVPARFNLPLRLPAPRALAVAMAVAMPLLCWLGARLVFDRHDFSRDEQMASFDAALFASGRLFAAFPAGARAMAEAFNQTFILPIGDHEAWVSAYLPMNAALRALFLRLGDPTLTGPFFVALGAIALWRIAARLWPQSPASQVAALLLYAGSSQVWLTGMTAYAMSAHLGLNLLWLWLFLKDRPWAHAAAIAVGLVATGLHQPLFHPLFVLPFLAMLVTARRWRLVVLYCAAYAVIGLFWLAWPLWISAHGAAPSVASSAVSGIGFVERLLNAMSGLHGWGVGVVAANLVRFVAWQHLLLVPLAAFGTYRCWNRDPIARALALGLILPVAVLLILLPYQGHGWGYRYLHGLIGNACLLGGYGWHQLEARGRAPVPAMAFATLASLAVLLPVHAAMAHRLVAPFARAAAVRDAAQAEFVIVDDGAAPFAQDLVLNRPDLDNRPLVLSGRALRPGQVAALCRHGPVAFLDAAHLGGLSAAFGGAVPAATPDYVRLEEAARSAGCGVATLD